MVFSTAVQPWLEHLSERQTEKPLVGMHDAAEGGEAAHTGYKGGLAASQAQRLAVWTQALHDSIARMAQAVPLQDAPVAGSVPCLRSDGLADAVPPLSTSRWPSSSAAVLELFRYPVNDEWLIASCQSTVHARCRERPRLGPVSTPCCSNGLPEKVGLLVLVAMQHTLASPPARKSPWGLWLWLERQLPLTLAY